MIDLLFLLLATGFFALTWGLVRFCDRLAESEGRRP